MTAQFKSSIMYNNKRYDLVAKSNDIIWFDPKDYGFIPDTNRNTACRAGYVCDYKIENNFLVLDKLNIYDKNRNYHPINDVFPSTDKELEWVGDVEYRNLRILLDNVCQEIILKNGNESLSLTVNEGKIESIKDISNIQDEIEKYCKERMTSEEFCLRNIDLLSLRMDEWHKKKRDVDMLPYSYVKSHWWLFNEIKQKPNSEDTYNYYALTRRNSMVDYGKGTISTIDGDSFDLSEFNGKIVCHRKRIKIEERHMLRVDTYWRAGEIEKCDLNISNNKYFVRTEDYLISADEMEMFKSKWPQFQIVEVEDK